MTPPFGASLADDSRVIIYDCNLFIVQATAVVISKLLHLSFDKHLHLSLIFASKEG